jgi:aminoglycoside 3-N-acetyltransferase
MIQDDSSGWVIGDCGLRIHRHVRPSNRQSAIRNPQSSSGFGLRQLAKRARSRGGEMLRRHRYACSPSDLTGALRSLGIRGGDTIMVQSAFAGLRYFNGSPREAVEALIAAVQPDGTVAMPAFPFDGISLDYLSRGPTFDVRRSPARTGLLSEVFRRRPDTLRSLHPTHSVTAWGPRAEEIVADHPCSHTPFDEHSPWHSLVRLDAWDVNLGLTLRRLAITHCHYFEERLEPQLGVQLYWPHPFDVEVVDLAGNVHRVEAYAHHPESRAIRNYPRLYERYREAGVLHNRRVGAIDLWAGRVRAMFEVTRGLVARGIPAFHEPSQAD